MCEKFNVSIATGYGGKRYMINLKLLFFSKMQYVFSNLEMGLFIFDHPFLPNLLFSGLKLWFNQYDDIAVCCKYILINMLNNPKRNERYIYICLICFNVH